MRSIVSGLVIVAFTALLGLSFLAEVTKQERGQVRVRLELGEVQFAPRPVH